MEPSLIRIICAGLGVVFIGLIMLRRRKSEE